MGCLFAKSSSEHDLDLINSKDVEVKKNYSWDQKVKLNPKDYTIENLKEGTAGRLPGTINGQQFIIQNCEDTSIYIFDHSNTVTVDDCTKCSIFIGPSKGSVFLRNCQECKFMIACQQFRTRDCKKMDVFLLCTTQPIIEASTGMKFGCFRYHYPELQDQLRNANLSEFNNCWSTIHDFTPMEGESNWSLLPDDVIIDDYMPLPQSEQFSDMKVSTSIEDSTIPKTAGIQYRVGNESCIVVFFSDGQSHERAKSFIQQIKSCNVKCMLINSREIKMEESDAQNVFNTDSYSQVVSRGPVIGLEYNGKGCIQACQTTAMNIATETGSTGLVYVSSNSKSAATQIDKFFSFGDIQMSA